MDEKIIIALAGIVGIGVGAGLQIYFMRKVEDRKQFKLLQAQAYVDFAEALSHATPRENREHIQKLLDAKIRISIYGSPEVCKHLSKLFGQLENNQLNSVDKKILALAIEAMRKDTFRENDSVLLSEIGTLLFGKQPFDS